jgi:hypothetical protein
MTEAMAMERRADLSGSLLDARDALAEAADEWAEALVVDLEEHSDEDVEGRKGDAVEAYEAASKKFDKAVEAATDFLRGDDGLSQLEREARKEIGNVIRKHVCRLPVRSKLRDPLISMSFIDHAEAVETHDKRMREIGREAEDHAGAAEAVAAQ